MNQDAAAVGVLIVTTVLAVLTGVYVWLTYKLVASQTDPQVVLYTRDDEARPTIIQLVVENLGKGMAYDVRFELPRPFPWRAWGTSPENARDVDELNSGPLVDGIPALGPGGRRVLTWGQYGGLKKALGDQTLTVTVRFKKGKKEMPPVVCKLDIRSFAGTDAVDSDGARQSAKQLKRIADALDQVDRGRRIPYQAEDRDA